MDDRIRKDLEESYRELYDVIKGEKFHRPKSGISVFVPMAGPRYFSNDIRFLLVGRAPNGWEEIVIDTSKDAFVGDAIAKIQDTKRMDWVERRKTSPCPDGKFRPITKSAFFRTAKGVYARLLGFKKHEQLPEDWQNEIAWTNLYALSPQSGDNPGITLCKAQRNACHKLLIAQLEYFNPTHVLIDCGYDFYSCFINTDSKPILSDVSLEKKGDTVCGSGVQGKMMIVVTERPERKKEDPFVEKVWERFKELNQH